MLSLRKIENNKKTYIPIVIAVIILIVLGGVFYLNKQKNTSTSVAPTAPSDNSAATKEQKSSASTSITSSKDEDTSSSPAPQLDASVTPQTPVGTFVSNHHPNIDGQPAPNTLESTCTTTAGAMCTITFTNGTTEVSLPAQQTDQNGHASWAWKLQDIKLTEGSWSIKATATNGTKSAFADDPMNLEVAP